MRTRDRDNIAGLGTAAAFDGVPGFAAAPGFGTVPGFVVTLTSRSWPRVANGQHNHPRTDPGAPRPE